MGSTPVDATMPSHGEVPQLVLVVSAGTWVLLIPVVPVGAASKVLVLVVRPYPGLKLW
ncbi:hypothetical protein BH09ACT6_BH09ACT6_15110 [soil metagenome]